MSLQQRSSERSMVCTSARWSPTDSDHLTDLVQAGPGKVYGLLDQYWSEQGRQDSVVFVDDLSRSGMRVTGDQALIPDSLVQVRIETGNDGQVDCIARVVWSRGWRHGLPVHFAGLKILWIDRRSAETLENYARKRNSAAWPGADAVESEKAEWMRLALSDRRSLDLENRPPLNRGTRPLEHGHWDRQSQAMEILPDMVARDYSHLLERDFQLYLSFDFLTRLFAVFGVPGAAALGHENLPGSLG